MAEITQKLGFDTSQGVTALRDLATTVDSLSLSLRNLNNASVSNVSQNLGNLGKNLGNVPKSAQNAATAINNIGSSASRIQAANSQLNILNNSFKVTSNQAEKAAGSIRNSFAAFRLLGAARKGLQSIVNLLRDASEASREFQQSIAEVQTIAGGAGFGDLSREVRALSVEFGKPTVEQAEAAYQAFSNQVVQTTADFGFLRDANKLAIATVSDTDAAVSVLSSVINSYGLAVSDASRVSDVLFKTVELGRTRLSEFANSLGTVLPLAKEAGIGFEEIAAGLATITKTGTTTNVALTQLRGIVSKILKPTTLMNDAFRSFGASDGPSAIKAAGGLIPLLQKMEQFAAETGITMNQLFGRIRAGAGALNILRDDAKDATETLDALKNATGATQEAFETIDATNAREAEKAFNELQVTIETLGDTITPVITAIVQGINTVIPGAQTLGVVLTGAAVALTVAGGAAAFALASFLGFSVVAAIFSPIGLALIAIAAATALAVFETNRLNQAREEAIAIQTRAEKVALEQANRVVEAEKAKLQAVQDSVRETTGLIEFAFEEQLAIAQTSNDKIIASFDGVVQAFVDSRQKVLKEISAAIKGADSEIAASAQRLKSAQEQLADIDFTRSIEGLSKQQQASRALQRALKTAAESRRELAGAGLDQDKAREALDKRQTAQEQLRDAARKAAATSETADDKRVADAQRRFLQQIIQDEKNRSQIVQQLKEQEEAKAKEVEQAIKDTVKEVENLSEVAKISLRILGDWKTGPVEANAATQQLIETVQRLNEITAQNETLGLDREFGGGGEVERANLALQEGTAKAIFDTAQVRAELQAAIGPAPFEAVAKIRDIEQGVKIKIDQATVQQEIAALKAQLAEQVGTERIKVAFDADTSNIISNVAQFTSFLTGEVSGLEAAFRLAARAAFEGVEAFTGEQAGQALSALDAAEKTLNKTKDVTAQQKRTAQADLDAARSIIETQQSILEVESKAAESKLGETATAAGNAATQTGNLATSAGNAATSTNNVATAANNVKSSVAPLAGLVQAAVGPANQLATALERAARARAAAGVGGGAVAFFGKRIHRQTGGFTRGQDRILTSTAPGEFVTNAAATRRFRSELTAMNAQQSPQFRETGGAVTNVGDINVNIQTQDASDISGRSIARDLKRELRTRTSSL